MKYRNKHLTLEDFEKFGYKRWESKSLHSKAMMQKKISNERGVKYYINFREYDWNIITNGTVDGLSYEPYVQYDTNTGETVNVEYLCDDSSTIPKIEEFFEQVFQKMNFEYCDEETE